MTEAILNPNEGCVVGECIGLAGNLSLGDVIEASERVEVLDAAQSKKKHKKKKKSVAAVTDLPPQLNSAVFRVIGDWPAVEKSRQTDPPTIPIKNIFSEGTSPSGEINEYIGGNAFRTTSEEKREIERLLTVDYDQIRRGAECHRQVRKFAQSYIRPGMTMIDICQRLEAKSKELIAADGLACGWGFPTGCSLNNVAAHYTPNHGDTTVLGKGDVMKLDFGVHVGGRIIDCAFSVAFDAKWDNLLLATKEATNAGLRAAGIDAQLGEIGGVIEEVISSFEVELDGRMMPVKPIRNLNGHSINPYQIHGGKSIPIIRTRETTRMEEGEVYAIETFASTGQGHVVENGECSHYMKDFYAPQVPLRLKGAKNLLHAIDQNFSTLAFCRRWLDDIGQTRHLLNLKNLVDNQIINPYPPLCDIKGSYTSQFEHTIILRPTCKEILSRGFDF